MNAHIALSDVLSAWTIAKESERTAIEYRRSLDKIILDMLPKKDEGSVTDKQGDYKATVTYKLDRKLDTTALQLEWATLPPKSADAIKWKAELSTTAFRALSDEDSAALSKYITTKPASPSVSVELIKE